MWPSKKRRHNSSQTECPKSSYKYECVCNARHHGLWGKQLLSNDLYMLVYGFYFRISLWLAQVAPLSPRGGGIYWFPEHGWGGRCFELASLLDELNSPKKPWSSNILQHITLKKYHVWCVFGSNTWFFHVFPTPKPAICWRSRVSFRWLSRAASSRRMGALDMQNQQL